jgi:hypothetical protein
MESQSSLSFPFTHSFQYQLVGQALDFWRVYSGD